MLNAQQRNSFTFRQVKLIKTNSAVDDGNYYVIISGNGYEQNQAGLIIPD